MGCSHNGLWRLDTTPDAANAVLLPVRRQGLKRLQHDNGVDIHRCVAHEAESIKRHRSRHCRKPLAGQLGNALTDELVARSGPGVGRRTSRWETGRCGYRKDMILAPQPGMVTGRALSALAVGASPSVARQRQCKIRTRPRSLSTLASLRSRAAPEPAFPAGP